MRFVGIVGVVAIAGCLQADVLHCADGAVCGPGYVCNDVGGGCVLEEQIRACEDQGERDPCAYSGVEVGTCYSGVCLPGGCGNGFHDPRGADGIAGTGDDEVCDDGDNASGNGCSADCHSTEVCGNSVTDMARQEECDDGALLSGDGCDSLCRIEVLTWEYISQIQQLPELRSAAMVFDVARGRHLLFGGLGGSPLNVTWALQDRGWKRIATIVQPGPRWGHSMVYDPSNQRVLLFGGTGNGVYGDTWSWTGSRWLPLESVVQPAARYSGSMAYDGGRDVVVLFGGHRGGTDYSDTWEFDGSTWVERIPSGDVPPPRRDAAMAYDPVRQQVILSGGTDGDTVFDDTWAWDGNDWTLLHAGPSPPRYGAVIAFDTQRQRLVVVGGFAKGSTTALDSLCTLESSAWQCSSPSGPIATGYGMGAYDPLREQLVLFGGLEVSTNPPVKETWVESSEGWEQLEGNPNPPPVRDGLALAADRERGSVVMFGGENSTEYLDDTWLFEDGLWRLVEPEQSPPARRDHRMVYDSARGVVVLHGGRDGPSASADTLSDTWEWDGNGWTEVATDGPELYGFGLAFDSARGEVVLFGGKALGGSSDETWAWDGDAWTKKVSAKVPPPRTFTDLAYDPVRQRVVLFGGVGATDYDDTWEWDGGEWLRADLPVVSPGGRSGHTLFYDPLRQRVVLFGGKQLLSFVSDAWEWDGSRWTPVGADLAPDGRRYTDVVWHPRFGRALLFGGSKGEGLNTAYYPDTWTYRHSSVNSEQVCGTGFDGDGDGLVGCDDPDCWPLCSPDCPPGISCDSGQPVCGDNECEGAETCRICAADCGECAAVCGDYLCVSGETSTSCPLDC